jgi:hypothetical protein
MRRTPLLSALPCTLALSLAPVNFFSTAANALPHFANPIVTTVPTSSLSSSGAPYVTFVPSLTSLAVGQSAQVRPKLGEDPRFVNWWWGTEVKFTSSNPNVVTVTETGYGTGIVATLTAKGVGTAVVTATTQSNTHGTLNIQVTGRVAGQVAELRLACPNGQYCDTKSGQTLKSKSGNNNQLTVVALDAAGHVLWTQPYNP